MANSIVIPKFETWAEANAWFAEQEANYQKWLAEIKITHPAMYEVCIAQDAANAARRK